MTARVSPGSSPALSTVAPFFFAAPVGLIAGGLLLVGSDRTAFYAINVQRTVAMTHALVLGWLTTAMMGALYQMGPAVLGGRLLSERLTRIQLALHITILPVFVWAFYRWDTGWMAVAGSGLALSLTLFLTNAITAAARGTAWNLPRGFVTTSLAFLVAVGGVGLTYALAIHYAWFPITMGRLSAHAHLGLVGWIVLTVMGLSYQLVPMFNVVNKVKPRFGWWVLTATGGGLVLFALAAAFEAPRGVLQAAAVLTSTGPLLWCVDMIRLLGARSKRQLDVQGRATCVGIGFMVLAVGLGLTAAFAGGSLWPEQPARLLLAYGAAGICGWAGSVFIGSSYKILPFLIWLHRYRPLVGRAPVPLTRDIYSDRAATTVLVLHAVATGAVILGALTGQPTILRLGGAGLAVGGVAHVVTLGHMFLPKHTSRWREDIPITPMTR